MENNINVNAKTIDMCLKSINNVGSTTYENICTNQNYTVAWGGMDWFCFLFVGVLTILFILFFVGMLKDINDY